ncbi:MAG: hypothetical protein FGF51_03855, partial [Candidatus Brockarchaeota archaeon]|nr:hypothetical protein [Candidatus Brockarchaeota archaeon]
MKSYLDERLKNEVVVGDFKPFKIRMFPPSDKRWRWWVRTDSPAVVRSVMEHSDGTVSVKSDLLDKARDDIGDHLLNRYQHRIRLAKERGDKEEEKKVWETLFKKEEEVCEDYLNRRNFEKHLKKPYGHTFLRLLWFDEVARRISKEYGVKVEVIIDKADYDSGLESKLDGSNMDEEKKFEETKKRVEAVIAAY